MEMSCTGVVIKKSLLPHPLLRDLHSDIELLLTNCGREDDTLGRRKPSSKARSKEKICEELVDVGDKKIDQSNLVVTDSDTNLVILCRTLEKSFRHGMEDGSGKYPKSFDYFDIFHKLSKESKVEKPMNYKYDQQNVRLSSYMIHVIEEIAAKTGSPATAQGRGRYFIRYCLLNSGMLLHLVDALQAWPNLDSVYRHDALVRQPKDSSDKSLTFRGLLENLSSRCRFKIDLANKSFLDVTWELPDFQRIELVPCKDLGLMIVPVGGFIVVTKVKEHSIAGEDHKVEVGDILEEMDSIPLHGNSPESIAKMVKRAGGRIPIRLAITKARSGHFIFPPMSPLLSDAGLNVDELERPRPKPRIRFKDTAEFESDAFLEAGLDGSSDQETEEVEEEEEEKKDLCKGPGSLFMAKNGYHLHYLGSLQVGRISENNSFLDLAISRVINAESKIEHPVSLHVLDFGVRLYCRSSGKQVVFYPYPKISACGISSLNPKFLSFIGAEDDVCSLAKKFLCHVFVTDDVAMAKHIVASMASGFDRTLSAA